MRPWHRIPGRWWVGLSVLIWGFVVVGVFGYERAVLWLNRNGIGAGPSVVPALFPFKMPGIVRPRTVEAIESRLGPDEAVIGVEVGGRARAYRISAFRDRSRHLVNDVVGTRPVTVSYCDINDCSRVYAGLDGSGPLDLSVAGLHQGSEMILEVGGSSFFQQSGEAYAPGTGPASIPLDQLAPIRTTWADWKRRHPESDVYEGVR